MHLQRHDRPEQIGVPVKAEPRGKVARRLLAVRSAMLGRTAAQVAAHSS